MVSYLRCHEGDVARIAPSLFAQRERRRRAEAPVDEAVGGAATTTSGERGTPAPGMPGGSPFIEA